jgi:hypothetical protein
MRSKGIGTFERQLRQTNSDEKKQTQKHFRHSFQLFLRNNSIIKSLKQFARFKLTTEDTKYKAFSDRGTNTYERDEKKKEKKNF